MLVLASPLLAMQTFNRGLNELPAGSEVRAATERAKALAGPGFSSPVHVVTTRPPGRSRAGSRRFPASSPSRRRSAAATASHWLVDARLAAQAESSPARAIVRRIRAVAGPDALVGGSTVFDLNVEHAIFGGIWKMLLFILGASLPRPARCCCAACCCRSRPCS